MASRRKRPDRSLEDKVKERIREDIRRAAALMAALAENDGLVDTIGAAAETCAKAIQMGGKVLFAGNGGSAADAQHLAAELVGKLGRDRPALPAISLTTDTSNLTAIANDYGYDHVFERQVEALGQRGDVLIGISTSGNSANIIRALEAAGRQGLARVGLSGVSGGKMAGLCDHIICIPSDDTQKIQEGHIVVGHILCALLEGAMFPGNG
jgi:D-sedoheptulose 7-phosphate isomerase